MNMFHQKALVAAVASGLAIFAPSVSAATQDWQWIVAPYGWAATIGADLHRGVPPQGGISTDTDFDQIVDKLDGAFEIHIEGQNEQFGMFTDFTYIGLASSKDFPRFGTESDLDARLFELAAVWSPGEGRYQGLDVFGGLRYIDVNLDVQFDPNNPIFNTTSFKAGETFNDFMLGARYTWALSDRWGVTLRGDGSFGDTEGTFNASAIANYKTKNGAWFFGYRYLTAEFDTGSSNADITMSGPLIGYGFIF